ncbi:NAD(P)-binding protein [Microthyrium microscopicum]|uniref:NAD(P)-binding protein n=1 Tax=Microthyrium microscopicum TaxID=703497 RepID=A0A6A6UPC6_9PEZI|nr:NAD(P)-binding protein [Microthyrium microscopicum]
MSGSGYTISEHRPDASETPRLANPDAFKGQTVIVTGGTGKIGLQICRSLAASGANVVVSDIRADPVHLLVKELTAEGYSALAVPLSAVEGKKIVEQTLQKYGSLHAIVQPIIAPFQFIPFEKMPAEEFRNTFESDVMGPIAVMQAAWPHFQKQKYGRIVNFTSGAIFGMELASTYPTTKGALLGLNKTLAEEGAPYNITVNCISPVGLYMEKQAKGVQDMLAKANGPFLKASVPVANVPMVLALAHKNNKASGEIFYTAAYGVFRHSMGMTTGLTDCTTVEKCLEKVPGIMDRGFRQIMEPFSAHALGEYQAAYFLGTEKDFKAPSHL